MRSKEFWRDAGERALKTFFQTLLPALLTVSIAKPDWKYLGGAVLFAAWTAGMSVLTSIGSTLRGDPASPSLVLPPAPPTRRGPTGLG